MALVPPRLLGGGASYLDAEPSSGDPSASPAGGAPILAFLLPVREGPSKRPVGSQDKPMSHFRKALAPLRSAHQHAGSPQHLEYHAHMSTTYTDIFYIRSIYKYINIYKYKSIMCSCRPRSLCLAQLWEARGNPHHVPGQHSREHGETAQKGGARKWSWGASACPHSSVLYIPAPLQKRKKEKL